MPDLFSQCSTSATHSRQADPCAHTLAASSLRFVHLAHPFGAPTCRRRADGTSQSTEARYSVSANAVAFALTGRETPVNVSISVSIIAPALPFAVEAPIAPAAGAPEGVSDRPASHDAVLVLEAAPGPATEAADWEDLRNDLVAADVAWIVRLVLRGADAWDRWGRDAEGDGRSGCKERATRASAFLSDAAGRTVLPQLAVAHTGHPNDLDHPDHLDHPGACHRYGQVATLTADAATAQALALAIHPICEHMAASSMAAPGVVSTTGSPATATTAATTAAVRLILLTDDTLAPLGLAVWTCLRRRLGHLLPGRFLLDGEPLVVRYTDDQMPPHATGATPPVRYEFASRRVALGVLDDPDDPDDRYVFPRNAIPCAHAGTT